MSRARPVLPLAILLLAGCGSPVATPAPDTQPGSATPVAETPTTLDGSTWRVDMEPVAGDEKPFQDQLHFEDRHAGSAAQMHAHGFAPASYSLEPGQGSGPATFEASFANAQGESFTINGKATADLIWGSMSWRRADWTLRTYRFKGAKK